MTTKNINSKKSKILHISLIFLIVILLLVFAFFYIKNRFFHEVVLEEINVTNEDISNYLMAYENSNDNIIPLKDENGNLIRQEVKKILVFGNYPFAEDASSTNGMVALLEEATGAEIINCALDGTKIAAESLASPSSGNPMDIYTPYYLSTLLVLKDTIIDEFETCMELLGEENPENAESVVQTLYELDPSTVDVIVYMYDSEDYWSDMKIVDNDNFYASDSVCGNLNSSFYMIKTLYPNNRIIYMSAYYNYYVNEDGSIETTEFHPNSYGKPSDYLMLVGGVINESEKVYASLVDNLYGSITEDNYSEYLSDNRHLTQAGRIALINHLVYAITYYDKN